MWAEEVASSHIQRWFSTMDRSWEQPTSTLQSSETHVELRSTSWAGVIQPAKVMDKSHLGFIMWKSLEISSWKEWDEILLQKWICYWEIGSPVAPVSEFIAGMGAFLLRQNFPQFISILYLFISLLAFFFFFLYFRSPFMVKKIWFPINNQSYNILEGNKFLEGKVCRKVELWASAVSFFFFQ